jgi:hypothetical protein
MSKYFFERLILGYKGTKKTTTTKCTLPYCNHDSSMFKGVGSQMCTEHQSLMREYGGPGRTDRPWTFNKKRTCEFCGHNPWEHPKVKMITDELVKDRVAWGMLIVDHIQTQRDGGGDGPSNCQTLCLDCNQIKTTLACDSMPKALYKDEATYQAIVNKMKPHYQNLFG